MVTTALGGLAAAGAACAEAAARPAAPGANVLGEIVVTAQKRSERLQEVPAAVTAISADSLVQSNKQGIADYFATVPGLSLNNDGNGQTALAVRGVTTGPLTNPSVGVVIDDVPFGSTTALGYGSRLFPDIDPSDLSQIEVLRGPQGTLYGAASIGGLIKIVTRDPSTSGLSGHVEVGANTTEGGGAGYSVRGGVNLPINDTFAVRLSGFGRRDAGFIDNLTTHQQDVNSQDVYGGMASALWKPNDVLTVKLLGLFQDTEGHGVNQVEADSTLHPTHGDLAQTVAQGTGPYTIKVRLYSANISADLGPALLTSITGYGVNTYDAHVDASGSFGRLANAVYGTPIVDLVNSFETKKVSEELRLSSRSGGRFEWLLGGFFTHEDTPAAQDLNALDTRGNTVGVVLASAFPTTFREVAVFGDATFHVTDKFDVQAGLRYSRNKQTYEETDSGPLVTAQVAADSNDSSTTYLVTARYRFTPDVMTYLRVASGYRVGGPNPGATLGFPSSYQPDTTTNYELGVKGAAFEHRLSYELSAYYIDWKDIQLSLRDPQTGFAYFANGSHARSDGLEVTLQALPWSGFSLTATGTLNDSVLTKDLPAGGGEGFKGDRLPLSSKVSGSLTMEQDVPIQNDFTLFGAAAVTYVGDRKGQFVPTAADVRLDYPAYTTLDLRWGVKNADWRLNFFLNNITDKRGVAGGDPRSLRGAATPADPFFVVYIQPRTVGLSLARDF
jgi:outer membrane receptor protein involved in Fe transport